MSITTFKAEINLPLVLMNGYDRLFCLRIFSIRYWGLMTYKNCFMIATMLLLLASCMGSRQANTYQSYIDVHSASGLIPLAEGETPSLIFSTDIDADKEKYLSRGYVILGESSFDTTSEKKYLRLKIDGLDSQARRATAQAKKVSATHVLYLRKRVNEYMETDYNPDAESYSTTHYETFENTAVYMVKKQASR